MSKPRFFLDGVHRTGEAVELTGADAHKIVAVLRLRNGDTIEAIDSAASSFEARLRIDGKRVYAELGDVCARPADGDLRITLAQAVPKGQKMDFIVEKCTELGAAAIVPIVTERTIGGDAGNKRERWRRLARTAAMQCGRATIPDVAETVTFDALLKSFDRYDRVLLPWELAAHGPVRAGIEAAIDGAKSMLIVIGPEGGFSHAEAEAAAQAGAHMLWLGPRILRTETAGMVVLAYVTLLAGG